MQDLTGKYSTALCPTSQSGGNVVFGSQAKLAMTAPGSEPVDPLPEPVDLGAGLPRPSGTGAQIPVSTQAQPGKSYYGGSAGWQETPDADDQPHPSAMWKQL